MSASTQSRLRVFFALWPEARARASLAELATCVASERRGRAIRAANLHVTLVFVGSVGSARLGDIEAAGAAAASRSSPFALALESVGGAANGIAWIGPRAECLPLQALHRAVNEGLVDAGLAPEARRYRPHVTLARRCDRPVRRFSVDPIGWPVERIALVASATHPEGSIYEEIAGWRLAAPQSVGTV